VLKLAPQAWRLRAGADVAGIWGGGLPLTRQVGVWGKVVSSSSGPGAECGLPTILVHFGHERTTLVVLKVRWHVCVFAC